MSFIKKFTQIPGARSTLGDGVWDHKRICLGIEAAVA